MRNQADTYAAAYAAAMAGWTLSAHARRQAEAKGFHPYSVMACVGRPQTTYESGNHPGQMRFIRDGIVAVADPKTKRVITVYKNVDRTPIRADQR